MRLVGEGSVAGSRAKFENSASRFFIAPTSPVIASVHWTSSFSDSESASVPASLRRRRCAESWMGVSGFLIS